MDRSKVLHLEGVLEFALLLVQEVIYIESYNAKLLTPTIVNKDTMVCITAGEAKTTKFFLGLLVPGPGCLFKTVETLPEFPDNSFGSIIGTSQRWFHVDGMIKITIKNTVLTSI